MKTLGEIYNLHYDSSELQTGLIKWYNRLIKKTYGELDAGDVGRMLRQNILTDLASKKAIELFINDPYDGEYIDGEILEIICSFDICVFDLATVDKLKMVLSDVKHKYVEFDWISDEDRIKYADNVNVLLEKLQAL